jgi:hypothetical protein
LYSNISEDLLISPNDQVSLYFDVVEKFELEESSVDSKTTWTSGKEAVEWVSDNLEENGRLYY